MTADLQNSSHRTRKYQSFDINYSNIIVTAAFYARTVYSYFIEETHRVHQRRMLKTHSSQPEFNAISNLVALAFNASELSLGGPLLNNSISSRLSRTEERPLGCSIGSANYQKDVSLKCFMISLIQFTLGRTVKFRDRCCSDLNFLRTKTQSISVFR